LTNHVRKTGKTKATLENTDMSPTITKQLSKLQNDSEKIFQKRFFHQNPENEHFGQRIVA